MKIALELLATKENIKKSFVLVLSVILGFLGLMFLPVAVLSSMGKIEPPDVETDVDTNNFMNFLSPEAQDELSALEADGQSIEAAMAAVGKPSETIKAQVIYATYFKEIKIKDFKVYAEYFANAIDDADLLNRLNAAYGTAMDLDEFTHSYTFIMNATVNEYMFTDRGIKNAADLAAWAENAYISGWGFKPGTFGERDTSDRLRYCDNAGLMLGYLNYNADEKAFGNDVNTLIYTEQGEISTMPEVAGIGLYDGENLGVYIGNGQVVWSDETLGYVTKDFVSNGAWTKWCTFDGIDYPQEVGDDIDALNASDDSSEDESID